MLEKSIMKSLLGLGSVEFPIDRSRFGDDTWSLIFQTVRQKKQMPIIFERLKKKGLIRLISKRYTLHVSLTEKGRKHMKNLFYDIPAYDLETRKWNKKWHMVIFDIPEVRKKIRDVLRSHLKRIGFIQVQKSVWVYPFSCDEFVVLLKTNFSLNKEVIYIIADYIEGETLLRKKFKI